MKRWFTTAIAVFGTLVMTVPDDAQAQRGGRGYGGFNSVPGYGSGWANQGFGPGWGNYGGYSPGIYFGNRGGVGIGLSLGSGSYGSNWGGSRYGYGNIYGPGYGYSNPGYGYYNQGYGYSNPGYGYSLPSGSYSTPSYGYSQQDMTIGPARSSAYTPQGDSAIVDVRVADANAEVLIDGTATTQRGTERRFISPPLESGHKYSYEVKVRWNEDGKMKEEKRTVSVSPGAVATVDMVRETRRGSGEEPAEIPRNRPNVPNND